MKIINFYLPFFFVLAVAPVAVTAESAGDPASARIMSLHQRVANELVGNISGDVRRARFRGLLREAFDLDKISRFVLGNHWRTANAQQQQEFKRVFEDYLVASYADSFKSYGGNDFKITRVSNTPGTGTALVTTVVKIQKKGGSTAPAEIEWRLKGQKIVDVSVENVSLSITKRQEFSSILQGNGGKIDGLIQKLAQNSSGVKRG